MVVPGGSTTRIGVPRSILHYEFGGIIARFLGGLGVDVELSPPTRREIFAAGKRAVIDELCFPIKIFVGHVAYLVAQQVDRVVIPVIVGHENDRMFPCHPRSRLADIVRALGVCEESQLLTPAFRFHKDGLSVEGFQGLARSLGFSKAACSKALEEATAVNLCRRSVDAGRGGPTLGLIGRPYVTADDWANHHIVQRLQRLGCRVVTEEDAGNAGYAPEGTGLHFALAARTLNLARQWDEKPEVNGLVFLLPFNCGPDGDIARYLTGTIAKPMLTLVLDELRSSAGMTTRLEAFIDLLGRSAVAVGGRSL